MRYDNGENSLSVISRNSRNLALYGDAMKSLEVEVSYPSNLYPFEASAQVLIEYEETIEGKEILGVFVSEYVSSQSIEYVTEQAKKKFYNQEGKI